VDTALAQSSLAPRRRQDSPSTAEPRAPDTCLDNGPQPSLLCLMRLELLHLPSAEELFWVGVLYRICLYNALTRDSSHRVLLQQEQ